MSAVGDRATLDTNVAIYAFDNVGTKPPVARTTLAVADFISVQLLNEFANVSVRKHGRTWAETRWAVDRLRTVVGNVRPILVEHSTEALRIAERYRLSYYDALMLAGALAGGARTIYSEDMHHDLVIDGTLRIVDPFR